MEMRLWSCKMERKRVMAVPFFFLSCPRPRHRAQQPFVPKNSSLKSQNGSRTTTASDIWWREIRDARSWVRLLERIVRNQC